MDKEAKRQALVDALKQITPEMQKKLEGLKKWGEEKLEQPDFVWDALLRSFATLGGSVGYSELIENEENYRRVTFDALSKVDAGERTSILEDVFLTAKIRYPYDKVKYMTNNYDLMVELGGPVEAKRQALAQESKETKIAFMKRFKNIGDKYGRNIWMDAYHPDFRDTIAIDSRIQDITEALGRSFKTYEEEERFYQEIANEVGLQSWELDRLLYNYKDHFLAAIADGEDGQQANRADRFVWKEGDIKITKWPKHED